jgi:hypothetical protein
MPTERALKEALLVAYGHFSDRRIKNIDRGSLFAVDDRGPGDFGADKQLFPNFCMIFADVKAADDVEIGLHKNVPVGPTVSAWASHTGARITTSGLSKSLALNVAPTSLHQLEDLAAAIRALVAPGAPRYAERSYKYVCPRVSASLLQLRDVLADAWADP